MRDYSISQLTIFDYLGNEYIGDLQRLVLCLEQIEFQPLVQSLDSDRGNGRDDYPNQTMFFILVSMFLFQRLQFEQMRRTLSGNPALRSLAGISDAECIALRIQPVPGEDAFTHFLDRLGEKHEMLIAMFNGIRERVFNEIGSYCIDCAGDGKSLDSFAPNVHPSHPAKDRRGEADATYSLKIHTYTSESGVRKGKKETHYGFRKHTIVDCRTELPVISEVYPANIDERGVMESLFDKLPVRYKERMVHLSLDRGHGSTALLQKVRMAGIIPIVDKRMMKKKDELIRYRETDFYYNDRGEACYLDADCGNNSISPDTGYPANFIRTTYKGYDKQRACLRYHCKGRQVRIYICDNPRIFNEVARDSKKFKREYNKRTSVERFHSRLDQGFGFESHTIRRLTKMRTMSLVGDIIMLALALAHKKQGSKKYASLFDFDLPSLF